MRSIYHISINAQCKQRNVKKIRLRNHSVLHCGKLIIQNVNVLDKKSFLNLTLRAGVILAKLNKMFLVFFYFTIFNQKLPSHIPERAVSVLMFNPAPP